MFQDVGAMTNHKVLNEIDWMFEQLDIIVKDLMHEGQSRTAYEIMVDICYQEHPTSLKDFVHVSRVNKSSINPDS